jgi:hypothetical protein
MMMHSDLSGRCLVIGILLVVAIDAFEITASPDTEGTADCGVTYQKGAIGKENQTENFDVTTNKQCMHEDDFDAGYRLASVEL